MEKIVYNLANRMEVLEFHPDILEKHPVEEGWPSPLIPSNGGFIMVEVGDELSKYKNGDLRIKKNPLIDPELDRINSSLNPNSAKNYAIFREKKQTKEEKRKSIMKENPVATFMFEKYGYGMQLVEKAYQTILSDNTIVVFLVPGYIVMEHLYGKQVYAKDIVDYIY